MISPPLSRSEGGGREGGVPGQSEKHPSPTLPFACGERDGHNLET